MENKKILWVGVLVAIVIAIIGLQFPKVQTQVQQVLGAVSTLDGVDSPFVTISGKKEWKKQIPLVATSSAILSLPNPLGATSTVTDLSCESTNLGIAQANNLYFGTTTSTSRYATTSATAWNVGFAMGTAQWSYRFSPNNATTTNTITGVTVNVLEGANPDGSTNYILGPTDVLYGIIATSTPGTYVTYDQGFCNVTVEKI